MFGWKREHKPPEDDGRELAEARALVIAAIQAGNEAATTPPEVCPALPGANLAAAGLLLLDALEHMKPTSAETTALTVARAQLVKIKTHYDNHLVEAHMDEGDLAAQMPDDLIAFLTRGQDTKDESDGTDS